eukprot:5262431-Pleurochrysis_carterae.AAC.1
MCAVFAETRPVPAVTCWSFQVGCAPDSQTRRFTPSDEPTMYLGGVQVSVHTHPRACCSLLRILKPGGQSSDV